MHPAQSFTPLSTNNQALLPSRLPPPLTVGPGQRWEQQSCTERLQMSGSELMNVHPLYFHLLAQGLVQGEHLIAVLEVS